uniref:Ig-like domain-containing protein n=1 Tax=Kryptolebias marmoratus TaxID=37003 RepID=A0A3Q3B182_KRYMA
MVNFTHILTLLCWICEPVCELNTVVVQPGEEVTLLCCNLSRSVGHISWFKLGNKGEYSEKKSIIFSAIYLKVEGKTTCFYILVLVIVLILIYGFQILPNLPIVILGIVVIFLVMVIITLVVKIKTTESTKHFRPKARSSRSPVVQRELEPNVVYAATR